MKIEFDQHDVQQALQHYIYHQLKPGANKPKIVYTEINGESETVTVELEDSI